MTYEMKSLGLVFAAIQSERGYASVPMSATEMLRNIHLVNQAGREAWRLRLWPEFTEIGRRTYRPPWSSTQQYLTGNEVWRCNSDGETGHYYRALANSLAVDPQDQANPATWLADPPGMRLYIEFNQPWESVPIDGVELDRFATWDDPTFVREPAFVQGLWLGPRTVVFPALSSGWDQGRVSCGGTRGMPARPWVRFRPPWPQLSAVAWNIATPYPAGALCFYQAEGAPYGNCYIALNPTTGEEPDTSPNWAVRGVPEFFSRYIELWTVSQRQSEDEGKYKTLADARDYLSQLEDVAITHTGMQTGNTFVGR
jgi:hypothetical protein